MHVKPAITALLVSVAVCSSQSFAPMDAVFWGGIGFKNCDPGEMNGEITRMTGIDTPTGHATASSTYGTYDPYKPFEPETPEASAENWLASDETYPQWIEHEQTVSSIVRMAVIRNGTAGYRLTCNLYGISGTTTNLLKSGIIIDSNTPPAISITTNIFENATAYSHYRWVFDVTEKSGDHNISIMFLQLYGCTQ